MPEIKFLNRSCAPNATATPNKPKPAMIGPIFIPQSSSTLTAPNKYITNLRALKTQFLNVGERKLYFSPT